MGRIKAAEVWGCTFKGRKSGPNQDRVLVGTKIIKEGHAGCTGTLPIVIAAADGISYDAGSEIAAQSALETVRSTEVKNTDEVLFVLKKANENILSAACKSSGMQTMSTTIAIVWIYKKRLAWCARGDSPIYLVTNNGAVQVNTPHTGKYGLLTSYLGADAEVTLGSTSHDLLTSKAASSIRAAAIVTDGVSKYVKSEVLLKTLSDSTSKMSEIGRCLMKEASTGGSPDNMSFVMARF